MNPIIAFLILDEDVRERRTRHVGSYVATVLNTYYNEEFKRDFRMQKNVYEYIKNEIKVEWTRYISIETALLCFIYAVCTGECFRSLASRFAISATSVSIVIEHVARLIIKHLGFQISHNLSAEEIAVQQFLFGRHYGQSDAVAAMDGCFCSIKRPDSHGEQYYNRHKKQYGMNMLAIVDFNAKFLYILTGNSGKVGDSLIF